MMALALDARLEQAAKKLAELKALKARQDAKRKADEGKEKRRLENKKKILLGAYMLHRMENDTGYRDKVLQGLTKFLTRPAEREIFGLPTVSTSEASTSETVA
jgi:hypothetical protein